MAGGTKSAIYCFHFLGVHHLYVSIRIRKEKGSLTFVSSSSLPNLFEILHGNFKNYWCILFMLNDIKNKCMFGMHVVCVCVMACHQLNYCRRKCMISWWDGALNWYAITTSYNWKDSLNQLLHWQILLLPVIIVVFICFKLSSKRTQSTNGPNTSRNYVPCHTHQCPHSAGSSSRWSTLCCCVTNWAQRMINMLRIIFHQYWHHRWEYQRVFTRAICNWSLFAMVAFQGFTLRRLHQAMAVCQRILCCYCSAEDEICPTRPYYTGCWLISFNGQQQSILLKRHGEISVISVCSYPSGHWWWWDN